MLGRTALTAAAPPAGISPALTKFVDQLPVPPMVDLTGGGSRSLAMAPGSHRFHAELGPAATFGYGGASYLGPTLQVRRGVPVSLTFPNRLGTHPLAGSIDPRPFCEQVLPRRSTLPPRRTAGRRCSTPI